ncbi:hypothetical protein CSH63_17730 [Micromonospora tulbaghiae]|uniref:Uncharacterized protein n=1 Tax=Micromonospora tulbaghiae TaxID=479978 RepID=A0A386WN75_9ACTN|nr:hypothetical protein [Micromonospora tulbaghiae]AYF29272.1 hypothetical protein CSH63_17730 [Micromonospora tulbaghiae]
MSAVELDLDAISSDLDEVRANVAHAEAQHNPHALTALHAADALIAEVRRLRAELDDARPKILTTEPGPEVTAVWDCDGDKWTRHPEGWQRGPFGRLYPWGHVLIWAPITAAPRPTAAGR